MTMVAGFPYFEVEFTRDGGVFKPAEVDALHDFIAQDKATDLVVLSHGWNNDMSAARDLYSRFLACVRRVEDRNAGASAIDRSFAVLAVLWPSVTFADEELIASGPVFSAGLTISFVEEQLSHLQQALQAPEKKLPLERARALLPRLQDSQRAQAQFANLVRSVLPATDVEVDDASAAFFDRSGQDLMHRLAAPTPGPVPVARSGAAAGVSGRAAGESDAELEQVLEGPLSAARNLLNYSTYYVMKERAGTVGRRGVNGVLRQLKAIAPDLRVHLVGHSFGARLVTAAADGPAGATAIAFESMLLIQAAFSHNAFAAKFDGSRDGAFRSVLTEHRIRGPVVITFTMNDRAVGIAYPLASSVAGQDSSRLGDATDIFGGLGRNGAQHTPEAVTGTLQPVSGHYAFTPGHVYNLNADSVIHDHSDICHDEVAFALLAAVAAA
jgi:hypothetical protein